MQPVQSYGIIAEQTLAVIQQGLDDPSFFTAVDIASAELQGSLAKVKAMPAVRSLSDMFEDVGLVPQIGHNPSSGRISFTVPIPVRSPAS